MNIWTKLLLSILATIIGILLSRMGSFVGAVIGFVGFCATIIILTRWLNSTNR